MFLAPPCIETFTMHLSLVVILLSLTAQQQLPNFLI